MGPLPSALQEAAAKAVAPVRKPRERKPLPPQSDEPLIQVNTLGTVTYNPQSGSVIVGMGMTVPGAGGAAVGFKAH